MDPRRRSLAILAAFRAAGMILAHAPTLFSGLRRVPGAVAEEIAMKVTRPSGSW
jgi:hypothetical protein